MLKSKRFTIICMCVFYSLTILLSNLRNAICKSVNKFSYNDLAHSMFVLLSFCFAPFSMELKITENAKVIHNKLCVCVSFVCFSVCFLIYLLPNHPKALLYIEAIAQWNKCVACTSWLCTFCFDIFDVSVAIVPPKLFFLKLNVA